MENTPTINLLTTSDLAERWSMSTHTLAGWRSRGLGPAFIKLGGIRYPIADVQAYETARERLNSDAPCRRSKPRLSAVTLED